MDNTPILSVIVDETTCRIKSIHRVTDAPKAGDEESVVNLSKSDIMRIVEMAENIPGVGTLFLNMGGEK